MWQKKGLDKFVIAQEECGRRRCYDNLLIRKHKGSQYVSKPLSCPQLISNKTFSSQSIQPAYQRSHTSQTIRYSKGENQRYITPHKPLDTSKGGGGQATLIPTKSHLTNY